MTFMDITFCSRSAECAREECFRHFGDPQKKLAVEWWGGPDAPVAFGDMRTETCGFKAREAKQDD